MKSKILFLFFLLISLSCNQEFDIADPNRIASESFYQNADDAVAAVTAVYGSFQFRELFGSDYYFLTDLLSDEASNRANGCGSDCTQLDEFTVTSDNGKVRLVWTGFYTVIYRANLVLDNVPPIDMDETLKNRVLAEARFLRAVSYFNLVNNWGGVPLITNSAVEDNASSTRATEEDTWDFIISEFDDIIEDLPASYPAEEKGRATSWAAKSFLGTAYLYTQQYSEAETVFADIVNNGPYRLMDEFYDNFTLEGENNDESIFEIQYSDDFPGNAWCQYCGSEGGFRLQIVGPDGFDNYRPTQFVVDEFETTPKEDPRKMYTLYGPGSTYDGNPYDFDEQGWNIRKFSTDRPPINPPASGINLNVLRFADVLLMYAEALNENGKQDEAIAQINKVRSRPSVDMPDISNGLSQQEVFEAIVHERIVELSFEFKRWYDLKRWTRAGKLNVLDVIPSHEPDIEGFTENDLMMPIPQTDVDLAGLEQNPGY